MVNLGRFLKLFLEGYMIFLIAFLLVVIAILLLYRESKLFKITNYVINSAKVKNDGFRLVFLSDLHSCIYGENNIKLLEAIDEQNPDLIICAGDMIVSGNLRKMDLTIDFMKKLAAKYKIYFANGNHEYRLKVRPEKYDRSYAEFKNELTDAGIVFLENNSQKVNVKGNLINIYGIEIDFKYYKHFSKENMPVSYVENLLGMCDNSQHNWLIAHNPAYSKTYVKWGADVSFSGHFHGGVMRLPVLGGLISPQFHIFPEYSGDIYKIDDSYAIVSKGIGTHGIPVRIFNRAEIVTVDFNPSK